MNEELESAIYKWQPLNASLLRVFFFLFFFPPQSVQVLRTRRASSCQDRGGVGQRDQGLVSEHGFTLGFDLSLHRAENERKPIHFSSVPLLCQSDFSVWFTPDIGLNAVFGKNCCARVPVVVVAVSSG